MATTSSAVIRSTMGSTCSVDPVENGGSGGQLPGTVVTVVGWGTGVLSPRCRAIDVDIAEVVDDDGQQSSGVAAQELIEQGRLARAEIAADDRQRDRFACGYVPGLRVGRLVFDPAHDRAP